MLISREPPVSPIQVANKLGSMAEAAHETVGEAEEQGPEQATSNDIDTGVQAVEVIGWVAKECASFFRRIAEKVKKYEVTGDLPEARASAQPSALNVPNGSEGLEKPKASKRSRKGGDKEKVALLAQAFQDTSDSCILSSTWSTGCLCNQGLTAA